MNKRTARAMTALSAAAALSFGANATAGSIELGDFTFTYGGYIKLDAMVTDYSDGNPPSGSIGRDWYVPSTIPVGGNGEDAVFDMHAQQSRFYFATSGDYNGYKVGGRIEMDFMVSPGGNERVSNSYNPRMRHAFVTVDNWLMGQTWTTFQNVSALPDTLDFIGPSESTIFVRQAQIRYTNGPWAIALENPETTVYAGETAGSLSTTNDGSFPDLAGRYTMSGDWGNLVIAGLLRQLKYEDDVDLDGDGTVDDVDDDDVGYGVSVSGTFNVFARDDIKWMASYGSGMGRYIGLNYAAGAAVDNGGNLDAIDSWGAFAAYRHWWGDKWRSTVQYGYLDVDNESYSSGSVNQKAWNASVNLIYQPVSKFFVGFEVKYAERELENGEDGDMMRYQFSGRYNF